MYVWRVPGIRNALQLRRDWVRRCGLQPGARCMRTRAVGDAGKAKLNNERAAKANSGRSRTAHSFIPSRFVRVILAQGPCESALRRSNLNGRSPKGIRTMHIFMYARHFSTPVRGPLFISMSRRS